MSHVGLVRRAVPRAVPHIRGKSSDPVGLIGNVSHACPRTCAEASQRLLESRASIPHCCPSVTAQEAILAPATRPAAASAQPAPARPARRDRLGPGGPLPRIRDLGDEVDVLFIIAGVLRLTYLDRTFYTPECPITPPVVIRPFGGRAPSMPKLHRAGFQHAGGSSTTLFPGQRTNAGNAHAST